MCKLVEKTNKIIKKITEIIKAGGLIIGVLLAIYHGIYNLNKTVSTLVNSIPVIEQNSKFTNISIDYDIALAEQQLIEKNNIDRILMKKLLVYEQEIELTPIQATNISFLKSKTNY